jgi:hypothetical protein
MNSTPGNATDQGKTTADGLWDWSRVRFVVDYGLPNAARERR